MNRDYARKIDMIKAVRRFFTDLGATEVFTPVTRSTSSMAIQRVRTEFGTYLRNCQELQLRLMMEYYGDVFEIGPAFRLEQDEDSSHGREFTLLEAQFADRDLAFLMTALKNLISPMRPELSFEEVSVSEAILRRTGVDIAAEGEAGLLAFLQTVYPHFPYTHSFELINHYIRREIEPMSAGRCVFFTRYPTCTLSLARCVPESTEIIERYELFVDGLEVSNGYVNTLDIDEFVERNSRVGMYTVEERYLEGRLRSGLIPRDTCVIGIGVERLCMAVHGISDIQNLLRENPVF